MEINKWNDYTQITRSNSYHIRHASQKLMVMEEILQKRICQNK